MMHTDDLSLTRLDRAFAAFLQAAQGATDPQHGLLAALASHQFGRGHACLDLSQLATQGVSALGWDGATVTALPPGLGEAAATLPWIAGDGSPLVLDGSRLYLRRNWWAEQSIRGAIAERLAHPCAAPRDLPAPLARPFGPAGEALDWQRVACALAARRRLTLITGGPGTGKTTTVVRLLALLLSQARAEGKGLNIALAAPTGKAAARLGESVASAVAKLPADMQFVLNDSAVTLHRLLGIRGGQAGASAPSLALDLLVVDEASMIDLDMLARLLAAVPLDASLILLADKDQLASVEAGAVMGQLCHGALAGNYSDDTIDWLRSHAGSDVNAWRGGGTALAQQTVMPRHSHRFANDGAIGRWASAINEGRRGDVQALWAHFRCCARCAKGRGAWSR